MSRGGDGRLGDSWLRLNKISIEAVLRIAAVQASALSVSHLDSTKCPTEGWSCQPTQQKSVRQICPPKHYSGIGWLKNGIQEEKRVN